MALVALVREGDFGAFESLYRLNCARIMGLTYRMVRDRAEAEDLTQEIFVQAFRSIGTFEGRARFGTWIYRIAVRKCLDFLKSRRAKEQSRTEPIEYHVPLARPLPVGRSLDLEKAIADLAPSSRAAFLLNKVEGYDYAEVSDILGVAIGTSKSLVHRARMKLRIALHGDDVTAAKESRDTPPYTSPRNTRNDR